MLRLQLKLLRCRLKMFHLQLKLLFFHRRMLRFHKELVRLHDNDPAAPLPQASVAPTTTSTRPAPLRPAIIPRSQARSGVPVEQNTAPV